MHFLFLERWFGKDWREVYLILHEDSTLMWYSERGDSSPEGGVFLKDCPEMIAAGQVSIFLKRSIFTTSKTDRQILDMSKSSSKNLSNENIHTPCFQRIGILIH